MARRLAEVEMSDRRLETEFEQLRVAAEDAREEADVLAVERDSLAAALRRKVAECEMLRHRASAYEKAAANAAAKLAEPEPFSAEAQSAENANLAEELRVSFEELQVLAEELEQTNTALLRSKEELEQRVESRTAQLKEANARLHESEAWLRLAQQHAGAGALDWDLAGRLIWSAENFSLHGLDPETAVITFELWLNTILPEDRLATDAAIRAAVAGVSSDYQVDYRIRHPSKGERWISARGRVVHDQRKKARRIIGLNLDITDRKRAELALARMNARLREEVELQVKEREAAQARLFQNLKLEALGQLTGGVAHDFNNLLSVIISSAALLRGAPDRAERERYLAALEQAAHRGAALTQRLLTFSRRQSLHPEVIDIRVWLDDMRELLARSLRADIVIQIEAPDDVWPALADAGELELAVLNLAVNARDAMPKGGTLRISAANVNLDSHSDPDRLGGAFVRLQAEDDGCGMTAEVLARAFEPFFTTKEAGRGTGLGLAQVYGFARQSGGEARVRSAPGEGTTITLLLPRATRLPEPAQAPRQPHKVEADEDEGRILLVEDDPDVADLTGEMLRLLGYDVTRVESASAAMEVMHQGASVDLVLTDVMMPGGQDGLDLAENLLKEHPGLPILLCSGYGGAPQRVAAAGLTLLRKPFTMKQLSQAVREVKSGASFGSERHA